MEALLSDKRRQAGNLAKLITPAEQDVEKGRTRPARAFMKEFKRARKTQDFITADQLGDQVTDQVKSLLHILSAVEMTRSEAMKKLSLAHQPSFRSNYVQPALKMGLIEMTQPDAPRSPNQRYRLTMKGRSVLEGLE